MLVSEEDEEEVVNASRRSRGEISISIDHLVFSASRIRPFRSKYSSLTEQPFFRLLVDPNYKNNGCIFLELLEESEGEQGIYSRLSRILADCYL